MYDSIFYKIDHRHISGPTSFRPLGRGLIFSEPDVDMKVRDQISQTRQDNITIFFTGGVDCPLRPTLKISGPWVGAIDVSEPHDFLLHRRPYI